MKNFIAAPSYKDIYDTCEYAYDVAVQEKDAYYDCTDRQVSQCNADFGRAYENEEARVNAAFAHNAETLEVIGHLFKPVETCRTSAQHNA